MTIAATRNDGLEPSEVVAAFLTEAPIRVDQLAIALGLRLSYEDLKDISGKIEKQDGGYKITVNVKDPKVRQRFTIAHEIGHYILHRDLIGDGIIDDAMFRSKLSSEFEAQANKYASYVLMPPALFRAKYKDGAKSYVALAAIFDVSQQAAEIRAKSLSLA